MKSKETFFRSSKPHWRAQVSSRSLSWQLIIGLLPVLFLGLLRNAPAAFWLVISSVAAGLFLHFLFSRAFKYKSWFDEDVVGSCIIFACLAPFGVPPAALMIGIFFVVTVAIDSFGGKGQNIFNPALIGFLAINVLFREDLAFCYGEFGSILIPAGSLQAIPVLEAALVLLGGVFLIFRGLAVWQMPVFYLIPLVAASISFQDAAASRLPMVPVLFSAFFLVTNFGSSPVSVRGRTIFAALCGLLFVAFSEWLPGFDAIACSILLMNSVAPLIDRHLSPLPLKISRERLVTKGS